MSGRSKEIINRGGEKISPREVDEVLLEHPAVAQAVAFALPDSRLGEDVGAAVVLRDGAPATETELREFAARRLADFKVPRRIVFLNQIPKGPTGKLQRIGLAARLGLDTPPEAAGQAEFVAPGTPSEILLAGLWQQLLRVERVGARDDFFGLGGDSLLATQLASRLQDATGVKLSLVRLFQSSRLDEMAAAVEATTADPERQPIPRRISPRPARLSFAQERLWFLAHYEPGSPVYNIGRAVRCRGQLDVEALRQALEALVARHETLRTTFRESEEFPVQVVRPPAGFALPVIEWTGQSLDEELTRATEEPFDLDRDLMLRARLYRVQPHHHVLLLGVHHIAADGWSFSRLFRELGTFYEAFSNGKPPALPGLPIQYSDFSEWQRGWLNQERLAALASWWKQQLGGAVPALPLPNDFPRPARRTFRGASEPINLPKDLADRLRAFCRAERTTLYMALLAVFQVLLARYCAQDQIYVGSPIANRTRTEVEDLIGFFVNTMVLRTDLSTNPGFRQLLAQVRHTALAAYEQQDLPFEKLVEAMDPARDMSLTPLIQAVFVLQNAGEVELRVAGLETECLRVEPRSAKFDLTLSLEEKPHGIEGHFNYSTDLFEAGSVRRMAAHFQTLLASALAEPERPVRTLDLLPEAERRQLLVEWNDTRREYPRLPVHELFRRQARERADAVALVAGNRRVTYAELDADSDRVAAALQRSGLPAGGRVGLLVERSPEMVAGFLGVLKAGGAYVPLDPAYPMERLRFMAADAGLHLVLTQRRLQDAARALGCALSVLEDLPPAGPAVADDPAVSPDSPMYVLYTSGSTGRPKGVVVPHRGVVRLLFGVNYARFGPEEVFLQVTTPVFDLSAFEIWGALLHGGRCVLYPDHYPTASELGRLLRDEGVTTAMLPPSLFNAIVDQAPATLAPLRQILLGGEVVSAEHVRRAYGSLPETEIVNAYGPTETSVLACCYRIPLPVAPEATSIPIGGPIGNTTVYVLDGQQQLTPVGVAGELYIGGDGVALEYLNLPQLTAERFLPDPFAAEVGARLYRTGDLVCWRPDGNLEFLGRLDSQVKLRGFRIELGEIEAVLHQHPGVGAAAVLLREDTPGSPRLVAYVSGPANRPAEAELRAHLKRVLPEYMLPWCFVFLDRMPLTANGKLDRRALPPPEVRRSEAAAVMHAYDPLELRLLSIWRQLLGTPEVGPRDDFFTLGGHSLLGLSLLVRIEREFGVRLSVPSLFEAPTVEQQAALLRSGRETHATRRVYVLDPGAGKQPFFLMDPGPLFRELARSLQTGRPILGLWLGECGDLPVPFRIEDLAAIAVRTVREIQPSGPYVLGGWCAFGLLAYEVAQQLRAAGEEVELLVLFDVSNPARWRGLGAAGRVRVKLRARGSKLSYHLARLFRMDSKAVHVYLRERFEEMRVQFRRRRHLLAYRATLSAGEPVAGALRDIDQVIYLAAQRYTPKPYSGRVAFFRCAERPLVEEWDAAAGWRELFTGEVHLGDIPGGHVTMFHSPGVSLLAERLRRLLTGDRERPGGAKPG